MASNNSLNFDLGTSGQVLTSQGAGSPAHFATLNSSITLISTQTASNSASLVFTSGISSTYNNYFLCIDNLVPSAGSKTLFLKVSTNGGSTYVGSGYQGGANVTAYNSATFQNSNSTTGFVLSQGSTFSTFLNANIYLFNLPTNSGNSYKFMMGTFFQDNSLQGIASSFCNTTGAVNALQLILSSVNLTSGSASLFGISQ